MLFGDPLKCRHHLRIVPYSTTTSGQCLTQNGTLCVFPWKYHDEPTEYNGCINPDGGTGPWCAFRLTDGKYVKDSGTWGYCNMDLCNQEGEVEGSIQDTNMSKKFSYITIVYNTPTTTSTTTTVTTTTVTTTINTSNAKNTSEN